MNVLVGVLDSGSPKRFLRNTPGPQYAITENKAEIWVYRALFAMVFAVILYAIVKAQLPDETVKSCGFWRLNLIDSGEGFTLLVALLALFYTRKQVLDSLLPYLVYEGMRREKSVMLTPAVDSETFLIKLKNIGNGTAIIKDVKYHLSVNGESQLSLSYEGLRNQLEKVVGLAYGSDYVLHRISPGFGLAKDNAIDIFEIKLDKWWLMEHLDVSIDFRGTAGSLYRKEVFLIPRDRGSRFPKAD